MVSLSVLKMQLIFSVVVFEEYFVYESEGTDLSAVLTCTEQIEKIATVLLNYFNHKNVRTNKLSSEKKIAILSILQQGSLSKRTTMGLHSVG